MQTDPSNSYFEMAVKFVNQTSRHIFLTGKAGTGKTTFLRYIKEHSHKKLAVVAPTGVAAINAGGVTIHSFFQLPLGNFLPDEKVNPQDNFYNRRSLLKHLRLTGTKRKIIQELDLLIIDEVSMVRADLLDAIDSILKHVRQKPNVPFGGVQMLYIGDLFQLPPVINDATWNVLKNYYPSPFFFHAQSLQYTPPVYLELKKIYRQSDEIFIRILNNLRNNNVQEEDIKILNQYYRPDFKPAEKGEYIILTTHNYKADHINKNELEKLSGKLYTFEATIEGEFNDKSIPANMQLQLKTGAQIMFIRNDMGEARRYYNGKIGTIKRIEDEDIFVTFPDESIELKLEKETWENIRYQYQSETDKIEKEVMGTFTQYPIRLAWAITIHKSQGLTFTKAIIDAGASFAPGQVYVALSRLTSLDGLVLRSPIFTESIHTDEEALAFSATEKGTNEIAEQLKNEQKLYIHQQLIEVFDWEKLVSALEIFLKEMDNRKIPAQQEARTVINDLLTKSRIQQGTAEKFVKQLNLLLEETEQGGYEKVHKRVEAAGNFFSESLKNELFVPIKEHYDNYKNFSKVKKYLKDLHELKDMLQHKKDHLKQVVRMAEGLMQGIDFSALLQQNVSDKKKAAETHAHTPKEKLTKQKPEKGASHRLSLELFTKGKSIQNIAIERGLAVGTIESHLISFISSGELDIKEFVAEEKINAIQQAIQELGEVSSSLIKEKLGESFSYGEIRAVMTHNKKIQETA